MIRRQRPHLTPEWQAWMAENLALGCEPQALLQVLVEAGVPRGLARRELKAASSCPALASVAHLPRRRASLESLLDAYSALYRQAAGTRQLERRRGMTPREFFEHYYFAHRPVVLEGMMEEWPALHEWQPRRLAERFGDLRVEIMSGRESDPDHDYDPEPRKHKLLLRDFIDTLLTRGPSNDYYLTGRNLALNRRELRPMLEDLRFPEGILDPKHRLSYVKLWLGPAGTFTSLHHDSSNVLFGQVHGRKHFLLVPSFELHRVYNHRSCWSDVSPAAPDLARHPAFRHAHVQETLLRPGDMLFIPVGWWHEVRALDVSVSVTFQQFLVPGGNTVWMRGETG